MGILTERCAGRKTSGDPCTHRFWRLLPRPDHCPVCGCRTSHGSCSRCGKPLGAGPNSFCGCGEPIPREKFEDVLWALPDGAFARRIDVTLARGDDRRFIIPAGVSALALVNGKTRTITENSSIDYWTITRSTDSPSAVGAEPMRKRIEDRTGVQDPVLTVVIAHPGPHELMLEFQGLRNCDGIPVDVQVRAEFGISSLQRLLSKYLSGTSAVVAIDVLERRCALDIEAAVAAQVGAISTKDIAAPDAAAKLLRQIETPATEAMARVGLVLSALQVIRLGSQLTEEILRERGEASAGSLRVEVLKLRADAEIAERDAIVEHAEKLDTLEARRDAIARRAAERSSDFQIHDADTRERAAKHLRQLERALRVEQFISDSEFEELTDTRTSAAARRRLLDELSTRKVVRSHELEEQEHRLEMGKREGAANRGEAVADAKTGAEIQGIKDDAGRRTTETSIGTWSTWKGAKHKAKSDQQALDEAAKNSQHDRDLAAKAQAQEYEARVLELRLKVSDPRVLAIIEKTSPELAVALGFTQEKAPSAGAQAELDAVKQVAQTQVAALEKALERSEGATREALRAVVDAVAAARGGSPSVTVTNNPVRKPSES